MKKKSVVGGIILIFLLSSLIPITSSYSNCETNKVYTIHIDENGTLSGYVKDTSMNPIEGAKVRVHFHETYEENYTDSSGYYHVTNIPICYCLKNATVSKKGYRSECVLLSIDETTTHNFVLTFLGNTLYVGGSGPGNYSRIQDAVDNASNWDTVFVYSGIYSDYFPYYSPPYVVCAVVDARINLIGEDKNTTIINGSGRYDVINIQSDDVTISGFTIQNGGESQYIPGTSRYGRGIFIPDNTNISINDNIIFDNYVGIDSNSEQGDIFIYDNVIMVNRRGIAISSASNSKIYNNILSHNEIGIEKYGDSCIFEKNLISDNDIGILILGGKSNVILHNVLRDNEIGLKTENGDSTIHQNNFINNEKHTDINKRSKVLETPFLIPYKNKWTSNYWDDWKLRSPRPLKGSWIVEVRLFPSPIIVPIARFPIFEFDWHPAKEPYDIP